MARVWRIHPYVLRRLLERYKKDSDKQGKDPQDPTTEATSTKAKDGLGTTAYLRSIDVVWGLGLSTLGAVDTQRELFRKLLRVRRGCDPVTGQCPPGTTDTDQPQDTKEGAQKRPSDTGKVFTLSTIPGVFPASFTQRDLVKHTFTRLVDPKKQVTVANVLGDIIAFGSLFNIALLRTMVNLANQQVPKVEVLDHQFYDIAQYLRASNLALFMEDENTTKGTKDNEKQLSKKKDELILRWEPVLEQLDRDIRVHVDTEELGVATAAQLLFLDKTKNRYFADVLRTLSQHISKRLVERSQDTDFIRRHGEFFSISAGLVHKVNDRHVMYAGTSFDVGAPRVDLSELYFEGILDHMSRQQGDVAALLTTSQNWFKERVLANNETSLGAGSFYEKHNQLFMRGKVLLPPGVLVGHPLRTYPVVLGMLAEAFKDPQYKDLKNAFKLLLDQNHVRESLALNALWYHIINGEHTQLAKSFVLGELLNTHGDLIHEVFVPDPVERQHDKVNIVDWIRSLNGTLDDLGIENNKGIGEATRKLFSHKPFTDYVSRSVKSRYTSVAQALDTTHKDAAYLSTINPLHAVHGVALGLTSTNTKPDVNMYLGNLSFLPFVLSKGDILGIPAPFNTASYGNQPEQMSRVQGLVELSKIVAQGIRVAFNKVKGNKGKLYRQLMDELDKNFRNPSLDPIQSLVPTTITSDNQKLSGILSDIYTTFKSSWLARLAQNETHDLVMRGLNYMLLYLGHIYKTLDSAFTNKSEVLRPGVWSYQDPNLHVRLVSSFLLGNHQLLGTLWLPQDGSKDTSWYKPAEKDARQLPPMVQKSVDPVLGVLYKLGRLYNSLGNIQNIITRAFKFQLGGKKIYLQNLQDITKYVINTSNIGDNPQGVRLRQLYERVMQGFQHSVQRAVLADFKNIVINNFSPNSKFTNLENVLILISKLLANRFAKKEVDESQYNQFGLDLLSTYAREFVDGLLDFAASKNLNMDNVKSKLDDLSEHMNKFVTKDEGEEKLNLAEIEEINKIITSFNANTVSEVSQHLNELTTNLEHIRLLPGTLTIGKKTGLYAANILGHEYYRTIDRWMKFFSGSLRFTKPNKSVHSNYDVSNIMGFVEGDVVNKVSPLTPILGAIFATFEEQLSEETTKNIAQNLNKVQKSLQDFAQKESTKVALRLWLLSLLSENPHSYVATQIHEYKMSKKEEAEVKALIQSLNENMELYKNLNDIKSNNDLYKTIQRSVFEVIRPVFDYNIYNTPEQRKEQSVKYIEKSLYKILGYSYRAMSVVRDMALDHGLPHLSLMDFLAASSSQALMWFSLRDTWDNIDPTVFSYKVVNWDPQAVHQLIDSKIKTHGRSPKVLRLSTDNVFPEWAQDISFHDIWDTLTPEAKSAILERFGEEVRNEPNPRSGDPATHTQDSGPNEPLIVQHGGRTYRLNTKTKEGQVLLASLPAMFWFSDRGVFSPKVMQVATQPDGVSNTDTAQEITRIKNRYQYRQHPMRFGTYRLGTKMMDISNSSLTGSYSLVSTLNYLNTMLPHSVSYGTNSRVFRSDIVPYKQLSKNDLMHMSTSYSIHTSLTGSRDKFVGVQGQPLQTNTSNLAVT